MKKDIKSIVEEINNSFKGKALVCKNHNTIKSIEIKDAYSLSIQFQNEIELSIRIPIKSIRLIDRYFNDIEKVYRIIFNNYKILKPNRNKELGLLSSMLEFDSKGRLTFFDYKLELETKEIKSDFCIYYSDSSESIVISRLRYPIDFINLLKLFARCFRIFKISTNRPISIYRDYRKGYLKVKGDKDLEKKIENLPNFKYLKIHSIFLNKFNEIDEE